MIKVGCCGFPTGKYRYFKTFKLVETQETFYKLPKPKTAERWREIAPEEFEFTVKCWQAVTHPPTSPTWRRSGLVVDGRSFDKYGLLKPTKENFDAWSGTKEICRILDAKICLIQCPPGFNYTDEHVGNMRKFLRTIDRGELQIAWEPRGDWKQHSGEIGKLCRELNLIHVVDMLRHEPAAIGDVAYTRLHGLNPREYDYKYRYTDKDLRNLTEKIVSIQKLVVDRFYVLFNNTSMAEDAERLVRMLKTRRMEVVV